MPHENRETLRNTQEQQLLLDYEAVHKDIGPELHSVYNDTAYQICGILHDTEPEFDLAECSRQVAENLDAHAVSYGQLLEAQTVSYVIATFPTDDVEDQVKSPSRYIKEHGFTSSMRPQLRVAKTDAIASVKSSIIEALETDTTRQTTQSEVDTEEIEERVIAARQAQIDKIRETAELVKALSPEIISLKAKVLGRVLSSAYGIKDQTPELDKDEFKIVNVMNQFRDQLNSFNQGYGPIVRAVTEELKATVETRMNHAISPYYLSIIAKHAETLPEEVEKAYSHTARRGVIYKPGTKDEATDSSTETIRQQAEPTIKNGSIGTIEQPFSWAEGDELELSIQYDSNSGVVYCKALPKWARDISDDIRIEKITRQTLDRMWTQVVRIEASNPNGTNYYIKKVDDINSEDFDDFLILGFGNTTPNAKRIYYAKTTCERFDDIALLAAEKDIEPDTPLLILLSETDKANQLATYAGFGVKRASAKARNVGAI